jgi:hypothetical protein
MIDLGETGVNMFKQYGNGARKLSTERTRPTQAFECHLFSPLSRSSLSASYSSSSGSATSLQPLRVATKTYILIGLRLKSGHLVRFRSGACWRRGGLLLFPAEEGPGGKLHNQRTYLALGVPPAGLTLKEEHNQLYTNNVCFALLASSTR